ncbi:Branched-chain amino acid transport protein [anaerobic digester metagenome]|jgi:branched-subunit amino acid transport protein|uniref:AzlD domain-containing protein n=1 Tax=Oscillibacter ruminantium TaxID=1263547 RepID=UPI002B1F7DFF|nr:AzlD domain-containing protein [Oscillibacter ruminantium]MEA5041927.1 AzlD domain-containing protein [Oscillibacter ruminantium]
MRNIYLYLLVMAGVTYAIRVIPLTLLRGKIKSRFLQSFLYYIPYATLAVMTFPAVLNATQVPLAGALAMVVGIIVAWRGAKLIWVASSCCLTVFLVESLVMMI